LTTHEDEEKSRHFTISEKEKTTRNIRQETKQKRKKEKFVL
jgi:hypothetical protein